MISNDKTLIDTTKEYKRKGFDKDFNLENGELICLQNEKVYSSSDMLILESKRFKSISNSSDMTALFVVECNDGIKGLITVVYGTYSNVRMLEFLDKVKIKKSDKRIPYK